MKVDKAALMRSLPQVLRVIPSEWLGTTFANDALLGREAFANNISRLLVQSSPVTTEDLVKAGTAEDYLRVSSNVSVLLELSLATLQGLPVEQVFTFSSSTMPLISVLLTSKTPVHVFTGTTQNKVISKGFVSLLSAFGCRLEIHSGDGAAVGNDTVLKLEGVKGFSHGVIGDRVLYILDSKKVVPADILVIRKRLAIPSTTPGALAQLQKFAGVPATTSLAAPDASSVAGFFSHLQTLCGTAVCPSAPPLVSAAGLPALCALYFALVKRGGAEVIMCSTAYGGSSQLSDILSQRTKLLRKHTFDIQGEADMVSSIEETLTRVSKAPGLLPTVVLFLELPTNPDMKVPSLKRILDLVQSFQKATRKTVVLLIDTTFGPDSGVLGKLQALNPDLPALVFISLSKHLSRGLTTGGTMIANHTKIAQEILALARESAGAGALDTAATAEQMQTLCKNHVQVEKRAQQAYQTARTAADVLCKAVHAETGVEMPLHFVTEEQAKAGFTTPTFSFNLPSPKGATQEVNEALAQRFVDALCVSKNFKACVSFGQDNGLVYATVPATSTQGALKAEDKAKQALGGVQLVRLSFPPSCHPDTFAVLAGAVRAMYSGNRSAL